MKTKIIGSVSAVVLLAGGWWLASAPEQPKNVTPTPVATGVLPPALTPAIASEPRGVGCEFETGDRFAFAYAMSSKSRADLSRLGPQATSMPPVEFAMKLAARVELEAVRVTNDATILVGRFLGVQADGSLHPEELNEPFLVEVKSTCELSRFARSKRSAMRGARTQQALLWETNWRMTKGTEAFSAENGTGAYRATLMAATDERGPMVQRRLDGYQTTWAAGERVVSASGLTTVRADHGPWLRELDGRGVVETESGRTEATFSMRRLETPAAASLPVSESDFVWENLLPHDYSRKEPARITKFDLERRARVAGLTTEQALATVTDAVKQGVSIERQWPDLAAWLEVHPDQTQAVVAKLQADSMPVEAVNAYFIALGNARTPQARDTLLTLKRDSGAPTVVRVRAMFALIDRADVDVAFAHELAADAQALTSTATRNDRFISNESILALTTMSGLRNQSDVSQVARETVKSLLSRTEAHPSAVRAAIKGVGNIGDPTLLPLLETFMNSSDHKTRETAAEVFQRMQPADTTPLALTWLAREHDPRVKRELYRTLASQHFNRKARASEDLVRQALGDLAQQPSLVARRSIVRLVATSELINSPEAHEAIKRQARYELEHNTGLLDEMCEHLTPEEVREVLR